MFTLLLFVLKLVPQARLSVLVTGPAEAGPCPSSKALLFLLVLGQQ